ncbi:MAG: hypothetical protein M0Z99_15465 [Betaproteobacteria bacterium]|nr:hypothetical protein [Betaproteobacteria bacterium]
MKKLLAIGAIFGSLAILVPTSQAAVGSNTFTVDATLGSACTVGAFSGALDFGTVTAFVAPAAPAAITSTISCTRTLTGVTAVFDDGADTDSSTASATPTGAGLLSNGLRYTISGAFSAVTNGNAATSASIGTADTYTFTVNGAMDAQAGTCSGATCAATSQTRTVTLNF